MYGEFIGCGNYPKCKTIIQIPKKEGEEPKVIDYSKKKAKKKAAKKSSKKKSAKKASKKGYLKKLASQTPIYIRIEEE
jgi:DNA topoisomerase-1